MPIDTLIPLAGGLLIAFVFQDELYAAGERFGEWLGDTIITFIFGSKL